MAFNIPDTEKKRIVIIGAGFGGFILAQNLNVKYYQVVLIDKNNFHQFQPLFYQVAMSGLEPSSICFPLRKNFRNKDDVFIRVADVLKIDVSSKMIVADIGELGYDYLVIATGNSTNYFGRQDLKLNSIPLKSVSEALYLRNRILEDLEKAVLEKENALKDQLLDIIIVGGGPTGVELAGSLAEMKKHIIPKDYPDLNTNLIDIHLIQNGNRLLANMSASSSEYALKCLEKMGVHVHLNKLVTDIRDNGVLLSDREFIPGKKIIWAAGVKAIVVPGLPVHVYAPDGRLTVDQFCRVIDHPDIYSIGDAAYMISDSFPNGLPALAPVAMQQARFLAKYLNAQHLGKQLNPFHYRDKGQMATIGRNKAVFDFGKFHVQGFIAWLLWLFIHIYFLVGIRNRIVVFVNWVWSYLFYDQALRLNIKPHIPESNAS
ncbi:MAG: NAD(P)/FAD-dependent oxidoreductase [Saprospiraceae bacterium]|nr:NAD(P)/FAD-dependent oxidoreductase [Saprospiraceae bacterium]